VGRRVTDGHMQDLMVRIQGPKDRCACIMRQRPLNKEMASHTCGYKQMSVVLAPLATARRVFPVLSCS
jgi:hypothetical protein